MIPALTPSGLAAVSLDGQRLSIVWDKRDPRNNVSGDIPEATVIERNFSFAATSAGDWNALSVEYRSGNVYTPTNCVMDTSGDFKRITMDWHIDSLLRAVIHVQSFLYSDSMCQNLISQDTEIFEGLVQEDGSRAEFWGGETDFGPVYVESQFSFEGENMRLLVTDCAPTPACETLSLDHLF